jgi:serine/threonine-protein kinase
MKQRPRGHETVELDASTPGTNDAPDEPRFSPGRYQYQAPIGAGGMGSVHSIRDVALMRVSAVKVLLPHLAQQPGAIERFLREAQIMAQLDHPNIVPVHELGIDLRGHRYFTMKKVDGRTLADWIEEVGRPAGDPQVLDGMLEAFLKVCDAVSFAHSRGVIHRDIKPDNVMVGTFGQVYLMDWGLALRRSVDAATYGEAPAEAAASPGDALQVSALAGTPSFMSPEQASGQPLDERTDVFSLGAVLYNILTGHPPFDATDPRKTLAQARSGVVAFGPEDGALPPRLCKVVIRATARDPEQRYATVEALRRDLELSQRGLPLPTQSFKSGSVIVTEGDLGDCAYVVLAGTCLAYKSLQGRRVTVRRLSAGSVFGETAVLSGGRRTASVEAETDVVVSVVSKDLLEQNLGLDTPFGAFIFALADRFRELDERVARQGGPDSSSAP